MLQWVHEIYNTLHQISCTVTTNNKQHSVCVRNSGRNWTHSNQRFSVVMEKHKTACGQCRHNLHLKFYNNYMLAPTEKWHMDVTKNPVR